MGMYRRARWWPPRVIARPLPLGTTGGTTYNVDVSESASATDAVSALATFVSAIAESVSATETPSAVLVAVADVSESASATDATNWGSATYNVDVTEAASAADAVTAITTLVAAASESLSASDAFTVTAVLGAAVSESASATDATNWGGAVYNVEVAETATLADAVSAALQAIATVSEAGAASDTVAALISASAAALEPASASDLVAAALQTTALLTEAASASDVVAYESDNVVNAAIEEEADATDHIVAVLIDGFLVLTVRPRRMLTGGAVRPANLAGRGR